MGVYIKGMEMPKNCGGCFFRVGQCSRRIYMENRPSDCPLIEVPEPHGRLIDADAALKLLRNLGSRDYRRRKETIMDAMKMLSYDEYTPTIIEAEEDE